MPETLRSENRATGAPPGQSPLAWREVDATAAEAELRSRVPDLKVTLARLEKAKTVSQTALHRKFSI